MKSKTNENMPEQALFTEISTLIEQARGAVVAQAIYRDLVVLEHRQARQRGGSTK